MAKLRTTILDFETYYDKDYSLSKLSYPEYILDDRFKVHALGVDYGDGRQIMVPGRDVPKFLPSLKNDVVVFHGAFFDAAILAWRYQFTPAWMIDTIALANHVLGSAYDSGSSNTLDGLALKLGLEVRKGDLSFMLGVLEPTPGDLLKLQEYLFTDLTLGRLILQKLLPRIGNRDFELWLLNHTLHIYTDKRLPVDPKRLEKTIALVQSRQAERVAASGTTPIILNSNKQFATVLADRLREHKLKLPMKQGTKGLIPALAKGDPAFMMLAESPHPDVANLVRGRLVQRSATVAMARLSVMQKYIKEGIPVHLVYCGAHTCRFAGGGGFNFQNLTSPDRAVDAVDREIAESIRESIVAPEGYVYVPVDAAQIEARVLAWLAGAQSILDAFATGADIYSQFISGVLGETVHKPKGDEAPAVQQRLKLMRQVGKEAVLGLGYNMGVDKFMGNLRAGGAVKSPDLARWVREGGITVDVAAKIVKTYRDQYPEIPEFWTALNNAFGLAYRGAIRDVGLLKFAPLRDQLLPGKAVSITLPSGRDMNYRNLRLEKRSGKASFTGTDGKKKTVERDGYELRHGSGQKIYGGLLAENITQAVARDILVESIYNSEQAGYPVTLHVHDEIVAVVPKAKGQEALDFLIQSLSTPPPWGEGLVLAAEGKIKNHLGK